MTQSEFIQWLEKVLGDTPLEELVAPELMTHVDRIHVSGEQSAWNFCKEDAREPFTVTLRALSKTMFIIGYDAGREQARIDAMFGGGSGLDDGPEDNSGDDDTPPTPRGLLPAA
jgi:hypothetical protein